MEAQGSSSPMKYFRRRRVRWRAGRIVLMSAVIAARGPLPLSRCNAGHSIDAGNALEHERDGHLAFAGHDGVDRAVAVGENFVGDEADAVAAAENKRLGKDFADKSGQIDHLGDVGEIIDAESHGIGLKALQFVLEFAVVEDLKVDQSHLMPGHKTAAATHSIPSGSRRR